MEFAVAVVHLRLTSGVEFPVWTGVVAHARHVNPIAGVARRVVVQEQVLEPRRPQSPVDAQIVDEVRRHVLAASVAHEPGAGQFPHVGIHKEVFRAPLLPRFEGVSLGATVGAVRLEGLLVKNLGPVFHGHEAEVIAPNQLEDQPVRAVVGFHGVLKTGHLAGDPTWADASVGQPRAELAAVVCPHQPVAGLLVHGQFFCVPEVMLEPGGQDVRVRSLQNHDASVETVVRGERAAINLAGIHPDQIQKGMELASKGFLAPHDILTVSLEVTPNSRFPLRNHMPVRLHLGTANYIASLKLLEQNDLYSGQTGFAQLLVDRDVVSTWNQPFVLRMESPAVTIAGGRILDPCASRISYQEDQQLEFIRQLTGEHSEEERIEAAIGLRAFANPSPTDLTRMTGTDSPMPLIQNLIVSGNVLEIELSNSSKQLVHIKTLESAKQHVEKVLTKLHDENPLGVNFDIVPVRERLRFLAADSILNRIFSLLQKRGLLQVTMGRIGLKSRGPQLTKNEAKLFELLQKQLQETGLEAPLVKELQSQAGKQADSVIQLLKIAESGGVVVEISDQLYLTAQTLQTVKATLKTFMADKQGKTMAEIRDALGTTRKYAVPLCEYLDRTGFTVRKDDLRILK